MKNKFLLSSVLAVLITSCAKDNDVIVQDNPYISFGVSISDIRNTRGIDKRISESFSLSDNSDSVIVYKSVEDFPGAASITRGAPLTGFSSFRAWAVLNDNGTSKPFFANELISENNSAWTTAQPYYWPVSEDKKIKFYALAGIPEYDFTAELKNNLFNISYSLSSDAARQTDLMIAETEPLNGNGNPGFLVPMNFKHICSAVRFKAGKNLLPGTIKSITLSGVKNSGSFSNNLWTLNESVSSFSIDTPVETSGNETGNDFLYQDFQTFMMLPQTLNDNAMLEVVFVDKISGTTRILSAPLAGHNWEMGKITTYSIGITPDFNLEFTVEPPLQDAHYVMCTTSINISGISADSYWTLTAAASDGADVSIQKESDANEYAKQGYWLDRHIINNVDNGSARGSGIITGKGNVSNLEIRVFIPENISETQREITLTLKINDAPESTSVKQTILQTNPDWNGSTGWEQIDDKEQGIYGFCYNARHVYVYNNSHTLLPANNVINEVKKLINEYNAGGYVTIERYSSGFGSYRNYVSIDYSILNKLEGRSSSATDGLQNTKDLYSFGGAAISHNFENALLNMERINAPGIKAYRARADNDPNAVPQWIEGEDINSSQALTIVLKKNRFNLNTSNGELTATAPFIKAEDIVWYLPASGQFSEAPEWDGSSPAGLWSSTAAEGSYAFTGGAITFPRNELQGIRVARNR